MTREQGREKCLEVLGLEPAASAQEIKAAYRDLAKVWHPDRFAHDPRLQQKAQEKLKEINDAYRRLLDGTTSPHRRRAARDENTGRTTRNADASRDAPRAARADGYDPARENAPRARRKNLWLALAPFAVACATFAFVTPRLISSRSASPTHEAVSDAAQPTREEQPDETRRTTDDDGAAQKSQRAQRQTDGAARADTANADKPDEVSPTPLQRALPTVSVAIDPTTNLRARADCPHKLMVTFPAGDEPRAYCDAVHPHAAPSAAAAGQERADKSRLKSLAGRLASPSKWFSDKPSPDAPAKKSAAQDQNRDEN
jgi:curved DNA-binding protein CbpA